MDEARLQNELAETKAELKRLRESLHTGTPTVHKDVSFVSSVPNVRVQTRRSLGRDYQ
jgi:hypothetical protein